MATEAPVETLIGALPRPGLWDRCIRQPPYWGLAVATPVAAVLLWQGAVDWLHISVIILPAPSLVAVALWKYVVAGTFVRDVGATLRRLVIGLVIGGGIGVLLGLLVGWYRPVRAAIQPLVSLTFPVPKIALLPLLIIWFGMGDAFKIVLVIIGVFYILLTNTVAGVGGIPRSTVLAAQNLGATDLQMLAKVVFPAALPVIFAGVRIAFAVALILVIAAEMQVSQSGLGNFLVFSGQVLKTEDIFAGLVVSGLIGLVGYAAIDGLERLALPGRR